MLIFVSSGLKPRYARDILDALCYPTGHIIHFRYRKSLIEKDASTGKDVLSKIFSEFKKGIEGLIVYADGIEVKKETGLEGGEDLDSKDEKYEFDFYPIRFVEVLHPIEHGDWFYIPLRLISFPAYSPESKWETTDFSSYIRKKPNRSRQGGHSLGEGDFVFRADTTIENHVRPCNPELLQNAWEAIIKDLRKSKRFGEKTLFFRVDDLKAIKEKRFEDISHVSWKNITYQLEAIEPIYSESLDQCIYTVEADTAFRYRIITYNRPLPKDFTKIKLIADPNTFTGQVNYEALIDNAYNEESMFLRSKRATESSLTGIVLEPTGGEPDMLSARPNFLIKVEPSFTRFLILSGLLLALGQLALAMNKDFLEPFGLIGNFWPALFKIIGFIFTFLGVGVAFRKLKVG